MDSNRNATTVTVSGTMPENLPRQGLAEVYNIVGMTPEEFTKEFSGEAFDYADLQKRFKEHCKDYAEALMFQTASKAVEFAAKVIYKVGPESRKIKPGQLDRTWRFNFEYGAEKHYVLVSTFKTTTYVPTDGDFEMTISVKQASLLAMDTLQKICTISANTHEYIFTPLAEAIFSRDDIEEIAGILKTTPTSAVIIINNSCQSGGQYLPQSDGSVAIVAAFAATRNLKDENLRKSIITKITKQYLKAQRIVNKTIIYQLAHYATGGVPSPPMLLKYIRLEVLTLCEHFHIYLPGQLVLQIVRELFGRRIH